MNHTQRRRGHRAGGVLGLAVLVGIAKAAAADAAGPNLILDHSFEAPAAPAADPANGYTIVTGPAAFGAWRVGGEVDLVGPAGPYAMSARDSQQSLDLNGTMPGRVAQVIPTTPGQTYALSFELAGNPYGEPGLVTLDVGAGTLVQAFSFDRTGRTAANMGWTRMTMTFVTGDEFTNISFQSTTAGASGPMIDAVSVEPSAPDPVVPEIPSVVLVPLGGLLAIAGGGVFLKRRTT